MSAPVTTQPQRKEGSSNFNRGPTQGGELWTYEIFGCFQDFRICCATFLLPCYTVGRNAEYFGESGFIVGVMYGLGLNLGIGPLMRWRIREEKNIVGSMLYDVLMHTCFPCCALIQENKELYGLYGSHAGEKLPIMERK